MKPVLQLATNLRRAGGLLTFVIAVSLGPRPAEAQLPVSGRPVPTLSHLDTIMNDFMNDSSRNISAGVLGVSRGGRVIFLRAYGELRPGTDLPETALMRLASVVKPVTAAAVQDFSQTGGFGPTNLQRRIFALSGNGGLLAIAPLTTPDANARNITLGHLLDHSGGWDRNQPMPGDIPINRVRAAGIAMNQPDNLPTRRQLVDWAMGFALNFAPGAASYTPPTPTGAPAVVPGPGTTYSNFGYLLLGEALEATAAGGYLGYLRNNVLSARNWIPATDWGPATTLQAQNNIREPNYVSSEGTFASVFDYSSPIEPLPAQYGGNYHMETMLAHGGLIASGQAMLRFGTLYSVAYNSQGAGATRSNTIGQRVPATGFPPDSAFVPPGRSDFLHTGSLPGASTILRQLGYGNGPQDDVVIFIAFNRRSTDQDWALQSSNAVLAFLDVVHGAGTWPSQTCDGFWVTLGTENATAGLGGFHSRYRGFQSALDRVTDGSYLRLQAGNQPWTGTIDKQLVLDAPEGPVILGQ
ncbi:MAG: serine hydrolase domain-containing protein [Verrucomicrobiales bacterium]